MLEFTNWFKNEGFTQIKFSAEKEIILTHWLEQQVSFKLSRREGFETFYKEARGGALIVFEVAIQEDVVVYEGYCPLLLFGIWSMKMKFKKNSLLPYPKQGYHLREKFKQYLQKE